MINHRHWRLEIFRSETLCPGREMSSPNVSFKAEGGEADIVEEVPIPAFLIVPENLFYFWLLAQRFEQCVGT